MKKVKTLLTLLPSFLVLSIATGCSNRVSQLGDPGEDSAIYSKDTSLARLEAPDVTRGSGDDDDEEVDVVVNKVILHYYNEAGGNAGRAFYLWVTGIDGKEYNLDNASDIMEVSTDGTMMTITIDFLNDPRFTGFAHKSKLFFIIKYKKISDTNLNWGGQSDDMQLVYTEFPPAEGSDVCEVWTMPAAGGGIAILDSENKTKVHGIQLAKFTDWKTISCELTKDTYEVKWELYAFDETYFKIKPKKRQAAQKMYLVKSGTGRGSFNINLKYDAHINMVYSLVSHDPSTDGDPDMAALSKTVTVGFDKLYNSAKFKTYYEEANLSQELGVTYGADSTTFRVWSPVSANMTVFLYDKDTTAEFAPEGITDEEKALYDKGNGYHMHYTTGGIWELTIVGDLKGKYFNYQVDNTLGTNVVMDPYATSAGACGVRGYIYDKAESNPEGWSNLPLKWDGQAGYDIASPQDLSIYEVHIQDFTGDESWVSSNTANPTKRGTYKAFVESGTKITVDGNQYTTGYDHLNELGVNAVQIVPTFDHDNDESAETVKYNWGYNPLNYNIPEGGYSSNAHDGMARVKEFKEMVLGLSQTTHHTRVIMDVVYNHVSSATGSNFHKLMPRYYFRYAEMDHYYTEEGTGKQIKYQSAGELWDGSGCHNEVASERPMMRKFIVDSLCMWAKEYKIKGFRFDLMGLIDFKTLNAAQEALYEIDPDIYMYGEGWTSGGYHGEGSDQWKAENPTKPDPHNFGGMTWQIYNECNQYKLGNGHVFLGGFNDAFRDAIRGNNGSTGGDGRNYPGSGFVQQGNWKQGNDGAWYCDHGALNRIAKGLWGLNTNADTNGVYYPEQTVNYVSCHDNWTVRDQLFNTLPKQDETHPASAEAILNGSLQAHALAFASNGAAFMLGGEELLRTKELTPAEAAESYVTADSWTELWGHKISHNSYNAPLRVNTFKWGNKGKIEIHGDTIYNDGEGEGHGYGWNRKFQDLIAMHNTSLKKRGTNETGEAFIGSTSAGKSVLGIYWSQEGNFSNCTAFQSNELLIYTCSGGIGEGDYIQCESDKLPNWNQVFVYGSLGHEHNRFYFSKTNSIAIYDRHGQN